MGLERLAADAMAAWQEEPNKRLALEGKLATQPIGGTMAGKEFVIAGWSKHRKGFVSPTFANRDELDIYLKADRLIHDLVWFVIFDGFNSRE